MNGRWFAAADLGASSGRVIAGRWDGERMHLSETHRFENGPAADHPLRWDNDRLLAEITHGFRAAYDLSGGVLESIGIDTWGVDYGRIDASGQLLEQPFHYRDARTDGVVERVLNDLGANVLYSTSGLQVQPFNTIFQLVAQADDDNWDKTAHLLFTPDLLGFRLTERRFAEVTIASTSGLMDVARRTWSTSLCEQLADTYGLPLPRVLPRLVEPGTIIGDTLPGVLPTPVPLVAVGGHDTACAVAAVPSASHDFAYVSSGTWSLVGLELDAPVLTAASQRANFTNELGVDGTVRYLKNVMGLWVLMECRREWAAAGHDLGWHQLVDLAAARLGMVTVLDMNDVRLLPPGDMLRRLCAMATETNQPWDDDPGAVARCVIDSLAVSYADAVRQACEVAGRTVDVVHIVGGGCLNTLLCQLTADATGLPVVAGPAEGTALGNLLLQARTMGAITGDVSAIRQVARASGEVVTYQPHDR